MLELLGDLLGSLIAGGTDFDVAPTNRQRIRHALRISRKRRPLTPQQHKFATAWLRYGLHHLEELKLERKEVALRVALLKLKHAQVIVRMG